MRKRDVYVFEANSNFRGKDTVIYLFFFSVFLTVLLCIARIKDAAAVCYGARLPPCGGILDLLSQRSRR